MRERHARRIPALSARTDQPLIGIILQENNHDVVRYFADEEDAEEGQPSSVTQQALDVVGTWSDLDWNDMEAALYRMRHETPPTPPIDL